jgi:ABC-type phosphate transport system permease subunit
VSSQGVAWRFFTSGDSREPELSGIKGALVGSLLTIAITLGDQPADWHCRRSLS